MAYYVLQNPPLIFLSLLPAPTQTILSFDTQSQLEALYGTPAVAIAADDDDKEEPQKWHPGKEDYRCQNYYNRTSGNGNGYGYGYGGKDGNVRRR